MTQIGPGLGDRNGNGNGWQKNALGALWVILLAVVGWIATDATTARAKMSDDLNAQRQRIAVLEESGRNTRESLARVESILEDIRRQLQDRRR